MKFKPTNTVVPAGPSWATIAGKRLGKLNMTWDRFAEYAIRIVLTVLFVVAVYLIYVGRS